MSKIEKALKKVSGESKAGGPLEGGSLYQEILEVEEREEAEKGLPERYETRFIEIDQRRAFRRKLITLALPPRPSPSSTNCCARRSSSGPGTAGRTS